ncbi:hypothetical protein D3C79_980250 [compost metagenome]
MNPHVCRLVSDVKTSFDTLKDAAEQDCGVHVAVAENQVPSDIQQLAQIVVFDSEMVFTFRLIWITNRQPSAAIENGLAAELICTDIAQFWAF